MSLAPYILSATDVAVTFRVYVAPRSSATKVVGLHNDAVKMALTAPPVDGAANRALLEFLAKNLSVPRNAVTLVSGDTSRNKVVRVEAVGALEAVEKLVESAGYTTPSR